jgi:hypothetical protein
MGGDRQIFHGAVSFQFLVLLIARKTIEPTVPGLLEGVVLVGRVVAVAGKVIVIGTEGLIGVENTTSS